MRALRVTLVTVGLFQLALGALFLLAPVGGAAALGLRPAAPPWANWLLAMMAGRFLGYAYGMFAAARAPRRRVAWIDTMIVIQAIDWTATLAYLAAGDLSLSQVSTAAFAPALFIAALLWFHPRRLPTDH
ncbi:MULTISPECIES: hypothetical protein [unclassified Streptomyces]|uniref:hypothetical protein n=1 Tax=unclassified Streptomyces TaxID=2593676 RepID=UPI002DDBB195|nr:hypothetical protein [Streptomyces sp. NBC_01750]WSB00819.1 hypothetical protein OIE54_16800 [Streptomyces sp. NBC_01794]WSD34826.1 hypothetical protein OG966_24800 [Streptomyces sp. NBC_01750]